MLPPLIASNPNPCYHQSLLLSKSHHHLKLCPVSFQKKMRPDTNTSTCFNPGAGARARARARALRCLELDQPSQIANKRLDLRALASTLHKAQSADDVAQLLQDYPHLPLPVCISLIKDLGISRRLDAAFALVQWFSNQTNCTNSTSSNDNEIESIYNALLSAIRLSKRFHRVTHVLEAMKSRGLQPNIVTFNTLMSIRIQQGNPKEVFNLLSQIEVVGLSPSPATYSIVLSAYKQLEDAVGALHFFTKFREKYCMGELQGDQDWDTEFVNIQKSTLRICLSLMRKWLAQEENNTTEVLRFLTCIDRADVTLDRHFFEPLVWACTREEHYPVARELYNRLRESGPAGDLSVTICNHIIWLMGKAKKWWAALEVYEEMLERGPMPNNLSFELVVSNFTILMTAAARRGLWRWALKLLDKMHEKGLTPTTKQWNAVLIACSKAGETDSAVKIFKQMVKKGEKPTVHSYGALLSALVKGKLYDEAIRVWEHMLRVGVKPNLYAYTILASMYAQKGDHDKVDLVLQEMVAAIIEPTVVTFNAIISGCMKGRMGAAAFEWFHKMKGRNVKPNEISYEIVIGALAHDGKPRLAYQMYVQAYNEGLVLNKKAYDAVVEAGRVGGVSVDLDNLGFHPVERRKPIQIKNSQSDVCGSPA